MKKALFLFISMVVVIVVIGIQIINNTTVPEYFYMVDSPLVVKVGETKEFVTDYYPDESFMTFKCSCEDDTIAKVDGNRVIVVGKSKGKTKIHCEDREKELGTIEVIVE